MKRQAVWDEMVRAAFSRRYGSWPSDLNYHTGIWTAHLEAELADEELVSALIGNDEYARRQRIWEIQLAGHLRACGHVPKRRPEREPDYRVELGDTVVWVEATSPSPGSQVPKGWLVEPGSGPSGRLSGRLRIKTDGNASWPEAEPAIPFDWILSRWTQALKEKQTKGVIYEKKGVIKPSDAYVIAVDGGQLSKLPLACGESRLQFALEAAFPIGPLGFRYTDEGQLLGTENTLRFFTTKPNGARIPTERFLTEEFSNVSAVLGCSPPQFGKGELPVQVIHNPLARVPVPPGTFGKKAKEWRAVEGLDAEGKYWQLELVMNVET